MGSAADYSSQNGEHKCHTYAGYLTWGDDQQRELINGRVRAISPAPFDVRLPRNSQSNKKMDTVVQPDISVVCDPSKLDDAGCIGAPDLVVEIVSRHSTARDQVEKLRLYEGCQGSEYWIVHRDEEGPDTVAEPAT